MRIVRQPDDQPLHPLGKITVAGAPGTTLVVRDGSGAIYQRLPTAPEVSFTAGGVLGAQTLEAVDAQGAVISRSTFAVDAQTQIEDDGGAYSNLLAIAKRSMMDVEDQGVGSIRWRGRTYHYFVPWILDHSNTAKGMQYFSPWAGEMVDLFGAAQKANGMIWSFAFPDPSPQHQYHYWAYKDQGYAWSDDKVLFARQPVENHNEANFVDALYVAWKSSGDDGWMKSHLDQAKRALEYSISDAARWDPKYRLLKRGYTIDSWDFQPDDKYLVHFPMGSAQQIDPERTKFVIFFGDNTNYAHACDQLAEMLQQAGRQQEAVALSERARGIRERLNKIAWNGHFYAHHVEIDQTVRRDLGVDETKQLAMSNMYSLNRGVSEEQAAAIIESYQKLREHLPRDSPGEWYAVYPPYEKGFQKEDPKWQYMNGGVQAHAAAELARGALEHGFENYGANVLARLDALGREHAGKLYFAYTGAFPLPPGTPHYQTVDISAAANMSLLDHAEAPAISWMHDGNGNDMRNLPTGTQRFANIEFQIRKMRRPGGAVAAGVSAVDKALPDHVSIPIGRKAAAVYLLHAASKVGASKMGAVLHFEYADGSTHGVYLQQGEHFGGTWFPKIASADAGVAWWGANGVCGDVGVYWAAIANPDSAKTIARLTFSAAQDGASYALLAATLADAMPWHKADPISYGGPDNWSAGLVTYALTEGLAGVEDKASAFRLVELSPRWSAAGVKHARVTVRYAASGGYVSYDYRDDREADTLHLLATGNAAQCRLRLLLPSTAGGVEQVSVDGKPAAAGIEKVGSSKYAVLAIELRKPVEIEVKYRR